MAKPIAVQKLKHGKALCGKTFGGFVDTFNWLVDFCLSIQGDKDVNNANGRILFDRSNESAPVIRFSAGKGGGGGGGGDSAQTGGCWLLEDRGDETASQFWLTNCWYNVGGITRQSSDINVQSLVAGVTAGTAILCATFSPSVSAAMYADLTALNTAQVGETKYVVPLYVLGTDGEIVTDLRNAPQIQIFEGTL